MNRKISEQNKNGPGPDDGKSNYGGETRVRFRGEGFLFECGF
jgi:hypothetical protein